MCCKFLLEFLFKDTLARLVKENTRELEAAKKALEESSRLNDAILSSACYMVIAIGHDGKIVVFNQEAERALQYSASEVKNICTPAIFHDVDEMKARAQELSAELGRPVDMKEVFTIKPLLEGMEAREWTYIRKDGTRFPGHLVVTPLRDKTGEVVGGLGIVHDITEQLKQQAALAVSEETFRVALEYAAIGMALVSMDGKWLRVNTALCDLLGYAAEEFTDLNFQTITHPDDLETDLAYLRQLTAGEIQSYEMEKRYFHKNGTVVWTALNVSMARYPDGTPRYLIKQIQDITERKQIEKLKNEFISTVSHELRTPLTSIRGALGLLSAGTAGTLPDAAAELITIAHNNSGRLVKIINDILDIEKIESGQLQIHLKAVDSLYILEQALEASAIYAEKCQVRFELQAVPIGAEVMADPDRLMQIMANLLSNAAKFSPAGSAVQVGAAMHGGAVRFFVTDHGPGIPPEFRHQIFEKFVQADNSDSRNFEGTGLGLSITKKLVEAMHGSIWFETELGLGSTFYFELPAVQKYQVSPLTANSQGPFILHVEDDRDLTQVLAESLKHQAHVIGAGNLREAIAYLAQRQFDLLIVDPILPDGSGLNLLEHVKTHLDYDLPVLILSAGEVDAAVHAAAHAVLVKSLMSESRITETILSFINKAPAHEESA